MPNFKLSSNALFCLLIMPCLAHGLDLGKVDVYSGLHENLNGKIALQLSPEDLNSKAIIEIAPAETMLQASIVFNDNLHKIHVKRVGSNINVFSRTALENPKVDLLLKISSDKEVKYRRVNLNLNEPTGQTNLASYPAVQSGHETNLLDQPAKKKKLEYSAKYQSPKKKKTEYSAKNQTLNTTSSSLPIEELTNNQNLLTANLNTIPTSNNNAAVPPENTALASNDTAAEILPQSTDAVQQSLANVPPLEVPVLAEIKTPTLVEQIKSLVKTNSVALSAFLIGILSILGYQRFKGIKLPQKNSPQLFDTNADEYTYKANRGADSKIALDADLSQTLEQPINSHEKAKLFSPHYITPHSDDFDFDFDFNLPDRNKSTTD